MFKGILSTCKDDTKYLDVASLRDLWLNKKHIERGFSVSDTGILD